MAKITYRIKDKRVDLEALNASDLYELMFNVIREKFLGWDCAMIDSHEVPIDALERGPIYYAECTTLWGAALDVLESRDVDIDNLYDGLEHFSINYTIEGSVPKETLLATSFDKSMLDLKRQTVEG